MSKTRLILASLTFCISARAQLLPTTAATPAQAQAKDPLNRETPESSVESFLEAVQAKDYGRAWRYMDLRSLPESQRLANGTQLAKELQTILDHDVQFDVANLSRSPDGNRSDNLPPDIERVDTIHVGDRAFELNLQRIDLHSGLKVWVFSRQSVSDIPIIVQLSSGSTIERHLPLPLVNIRIFDTPLWRWIGLLLLAIALAAFSKWLSRLVLWLTQIVMKRLAPRARLTTLESFLGPLRLLLSVALFRAGMVWLGPSALLRLYLGRVLGFLFFCGVFWLCAVIIDVVVLRLRSRLETRHRAFSYSVLPLAGRFTKIIVLLFIIAAILTSWGYNTTTLLAGLGIGGVAIALASQKTIENLFGSVSVISDRPVSVGDFCKFGNYVGTVEDIGLRSTRIRTLDRTLVTVPNGSFSTMTLENFAPRDKMLFHVTLSLKREASPDQLRGLLESLTKLFKESDKVDGGDFPVRFVGIGTYSLDVEIFAYVLTPDFTEFLKMQQLLFLNIMDTIHNAGMALAIPTQALVNYAVPAPNGNAAPALQGAAPSTDARN
jgi:MscS family membrane protein